MLPREIFHFLSCHSSSRVLQYRCPSFAANKRNPALTKPVCSLWMLKLTICEFLKRLTTNIWRSSHELLLRLIYYYLAATFVAIIIADLTECHSITHYWQVVPDPGPQCRQGYAMLITMAVANVTTDILLIVFPIPIILSSQMPFRRKMHLILLFGLSIVPVGITLYRVPSIIEFRGSQQHRSLWASIEILFATVVANALVLGSFMRDRGLKKSRYKLGSMTGSMERTESARRGTATAFKHWGSDEDLVRGLGIGVEHSLRNERHENRVPRPAPVAMENGHGSGDVDRGWNFPQVRKEGDSEEETDSIIHFPAQIGVLPSEMANTPRKVNFFDVGNLLGAEIPRPAALRDSQFSEAPLLSGASSNLGHMKMSGANNSGNSHAESQGVAGAGYGNGGNGGNYPFTAFAYGGYGQQNRAGNPMSNDMSDSPSGGGASIFLQDVGGLLTPTVSLPTPHSRSQTTVDRRPSLAVQPEKKGAAAGGAAEAIRQWGTRQARREKSDTDVELNNLDSGAKKSVQWGALSPQPEKKKAPAAPVLPLQLARSQRDGTGEAGMDLNDVGGLLR